ncbi:rod shape-determining protein, partial [Acinetobacter pittii]|uniref:rod shape-determining protein n=1 Tax=Acinetobacter pittii TaxID=48296 RepID=UPI002812B39C
LGIDLGTSSLVIAMPGKGIVLNEPSYIAYNVEDEKMIYAGKRAYYLQGREPQGVQVAQPLKDGVIGSYKLT